MNLYVIIFVLIIVAFIVIGQLFSKKAVIKRKLKNAEFRKISEFKNGEIAKIVGHVEFVTNPLISPLSGRDCSYYYVHIEQKVSSGKSSRWKTIIEEELSSKFLINDNANFAYINDNNLKSYIVQDRNFSSGFLNDATDNLEEYLNNKGYKSEGLLGLNKILRYKEGILENGEQISVFGKGEWKDAKELNLPEKYGNILEIKSDNEVAVYLSDDPSTTIKNAKKMNSSKKRYKKEKY